MTLYHYTTLENFFSIWRSKSLRFSYSKNTNDYFEREKAFAYDQGKFAEKEPVWGYLSFKSIRKLVSVKAIGSIKIVKIEADDSIEEPEHAHSEHHEK